MKYLLFVVFVLLSCPLHALISIVEADTVGTVEFADPLTVVMSNSLLDGDLLLVVANVNGTDNSGSGTTISGGGSWTTFHSNNNHAAWYQTVSGSHGAPTITVTFNGNIAYNRVICVALLRGVPSFSISTSYDGAGPPSVVVAGVTLSFNAGTGSGIMVAILIPSSATSLEGASAIALIAGNDGWTVPTGASLSPWNNIISGFAGTGIFWQGACVGVCNRNVRHRSQIL